MLLIMVISFCAFCTIPKETDSLSLDKRSIDHNKYLANYGEPVKVGNSYLTEEDVVDSDEDTLFEVKNPNKHQTKYAYNYFGNDLEKTPEKLKNTIPKVHNYKDHVITKQPKKKTSSDEFNTYYVAEDVYAGMNRHIPHLDDSSELAQVECKNLKLKPPIDQIMKNSQSSEEPSINEEIFENVVKVNSETENKTETRTTTDLPTSITTVELNVTEPCTETSITNVTESVVADVEEVVVNDNNMEAPLNLEEKLNKVQENITTIADTTLTDLSTVTNATTQKTR